MALLVDVRAVGLAFGGARALHELDLDLHSGEVVGLFGPKGAGKSVTLELIIGARAPSEGRVFFAGRDVTPLSSSSRARLGLAFVGRDPRPLAGLTVMENLLVATTRGVLTRTAKHLGRVVEVVERTGLAAVVNQPAETLDLVERKRLELARAIAPRPRVVLIDELSHGLDPSTAAELAESVRQLQHTGVSVIWAERLPRALAPFADRLVALDSGHKIAEGAPGDVLASPQVRDWTIGVSR